MFEGIPIKLQLGYFVKFIAYVVAVQHISLDFPMLMQDLGKFQTHRCLHASRMHCNICFLVKLQLVKEV